MMNSETTPPNESENRRNPSRQSREQVRSPGVQMPDPGEVFRPSNSTPDQGRIPFSASNSMNSTYLPPQNIFSPIRGSTGEGHVDPPSSSARRTKEPSGQNIFGKR